MRRYMTSKMNNNTSEGKENVNFMHGPIIYGSNLSWKSRNVWHLKQNIKFHKNNNFPLRLI